MHSFHTQTGHLPKSITFQAIQPSFQELQSGEMMEGALENPFSRAQIVLGIDNKNCLESPHMF